MTEKVFLSYAHQDSAFAKSLTKKLKKLLRTDATNIEIFDAQKDVAAGENVREAIRKAMDASSTVVIVSSRYSDDSDWVNYEAGMADALGKEVLLVGRKGSGKSSLFQYLKANVRLIEVNDTD